MRRLDPEEMNLPHRDALDFPFSEPPAPGEVREVVPGILWARIPLPFRLDHVNVYLIEDDGGWAILDTGIAHDSTRAAWEMLLSGPLSGWRFTKVVITHFHPDHIGLAGWLCERFGVPLLTSQTSYLGCINISLDPGALEAQHYRDFYLRHGMTSETAQLVSTQGHGYLRMVMPLPPTFRRLVGGDELVLGGRRFPVLSGDGHAPEQIMLYAPDDRLLLAADQVIAKISPNISVWAVEPDGDPLGLYLRSLKALERDLPEDTLVLPGHQLPFRGLHRRCRELADHHAVRCRLIADACSAGSRTVADLVPVLFKRELDPHQLSFAFSETHAHVNHMVRRGELAWQDEAGMHRLVLAR
ncbi:MAG TPA: MBL fold metallo-hydrolase [Rhizobiaceae bacterium]|nr:MBL fold metallo-hydrolase [Rhizobiaceae bacterium]